jgi:hypothetical protein
MSSEALYKQLCALQVEESEFQAPLSDSNMRWLARLYALLDSQGVRTSLEAVNFKSAWDKLAASGDPWERGLAKQQIDAVLARAIARAELDAPSAVQGTFIGVGAEFSAFQAIGKVLEPARADVVIVDPYLNDKVLADFGLLVAETVPLRLLCDAEHKGYTAGLAAAARWIAQFGSQQPLQVRATAPRALHDRLILIDRQDVWSLTQSLKDLAVRSPASLQKIDHEIAGLKLKFYEDLWSRSTPL